MKVTVAKTAGFCFGVQRAIDMVYKEIENGTGQIYTYGPIIHNEHVVNDLKNKGVIVLNTREELDSIKEGTVIIRSHGVPKEILDSLSRDNIKVVNATCPFVSKIHKIAKKASDEGQRVIITGNPDHPEVQGIAGWCDNYLVVNKKSDLSNFNEDPTIKTTIVSQTTFNSYEFQDLVDFLQKLVYDTTVANTICNATAERQKEARDIALLVDAMIVIGDMHSSNTQKLYEICKQFCKLSYFIETLDDLKPVNFQSLGHIGITAGASTPKNIIEEVQNYVRNEF